MKIIRKKQWTYVGGAFPLILELNVIDWKATLKTILPP
jgi:hypothetical protein